MNSHIIEFQINTTSKIILQTTDNIHNLLCCDNAVFTLKINNQEILLYDDEIYQGINHLHTMLTKAINNNVILHESIHHDIGYVYNEEIQNKPGLFYITLEGRKFWIGRIYHLWTEKYIATWIYNDKENIVFKATPIYPASFLPKKEAASLISYKKWMLNYKPYFTATISLGTAQEWIEKTEYIIHTIDDNIRQWRGDKKRYDNHQLEP